MSLTKKEQCLLHYSMNYINVLTYAFTYSNNTLMSIIHKLLTHPDLRVRRPLLYWSNLAGVSHIWQLKAKMPLLQTRTTAKQMSRYSWPGNNLNKIHTKFQHSCSINEKLEISSKLCWSEYVQSYKNITRFILKNL